MSGNIKVHKSTQTVGDVEVSTAIVVPTPELDKLSAISDESQSIGAFLDWIQNERKETLTICATERSTGDYYPIRIRIQALLAEYFKIDENKLEEERRALLNAIRR